MGHFRGRRGGLGGWRGADGGEGGGGGRGRRLRALPCPSGRADPDGSDMFEGLVRWPSSLRAGLDRAGRVANGLAGGGGGGGGTGRRGWLSDQNGLGTEGCTSHFSEETSIPGRQWKP
ncbi:uncharacterized protein LOC106661576 [Cimex lectularius]|uniref:Uncharacterized protein n=1 Tax=Cimex lectularius TaxID=79782 RepID=A0A8I6R8R1_CIMLE|nr:uncharacterized protein LOC106661576 [Cimex lectularius]